MTTLNDIDKLTKKYAEGRESLGNIIRSMEDEVNEVKRRYMPRIKNVVALLAERQAGLKAAIEEGDHLFQKPRTIIFHGIRVGYMKGKGEITWENTDQVVKLIHKHFPEQEDVLLKVTETPVKTALAQMSVQDLKRIGVTVIESGDQVVIKSTDSEIDKLVSALLKEDEMKEAKAAA